MSLESKNLAFLHPSKFINSVCTLRVVIQFKSTTESALQSSQSHHENTSQLMLPKKKRKEGRKNVKKNTHKIRTAGGGGELRLFGTLVCFKIIFHFHIPNSLNSKQIKVLQIIPEKKK